MKKNIKEKLKSATRLMICCGNVSGYDSLTSAKSIISIKDIIKDVNDSIINNFNRIRNLKTNSNYENIFKN